jgi:predicted acetyltransferase
LKNPSVQNIELRLALATDESCIDSLMQLYCHDASEWYPIDLEADGTLMGRYKVRPVARFWTEANQHPFLIFVDDALAGFAVVDSEVVDTDSQWGIGYFFIVRRFRKRGVGRRAAHELFRRFIGRWEVYELVANVNAISFWRAAIAEFSCGAFKELGLVIHGEACVQQRFST